METSGISTYMMEAPVLLPVPLSPSCISQNQTRGETKKAHQNLQKEHWTKKQETWGPEHPSQAITEQELMSLLLHWLPRWASGRAWR